MFGSGSVNVISVLERMPAGWAADFELATRIGASLVVGLREDLERFPVDHFDCA